MNIIPLFVAIPLGMAFFIPMVGRKARKLPDLLGNLTTLVLLIMSLSVIGKSGIYWMGGWSPRSGIPIGINLVLDGLSGFILVTVSLVSFMATLFSVQYMEQYTSKLHYYSLFLLMVAGMNGVVLSGDMFNIFVFLEIASIASYALVGFGCRHEELEASFKYLVLGSIASILILFGVALCYAMTGTLNMAHLGQLIRGDMNPPILLALTFFLAGFSLKAALVPFHAWLPDAHPSAPAPISAMLSGVLIKAIGIYALIRVIFNVFGLTPLLSSILTTLGTLSMIVSVLLAIGQWDLKRLLAYHSISQIGYVILGIGLGTPLGILGGLFHLINHAAFKSLLFLNAGAIEYTTGTRELERMGGLNKKMPVTGSTSIIASMSIAGIPPFNGFWSKLIIIMACVNAGRFGLAGWAVFVSIMTLASFMKVQKYAFFDELKKARERVKEVPALMCFSMILLAILCVTMGLLWHSWVVDLFLGPARDVLVAGTNYAATVLGN
ncbi:NADH/ubiquinone/plastoquinone (complex I) [candidate division NPL-UPA2 bacterium]|nr:NADH/ubiquinone/plastoquinone (complex I) [candidate division NPL-UPA2 bacterium]